MIYAFTGQPGAGKTLNAIKFVLEDTAFCLPDPDNPKKRLKEKRTVYYYGIKGLNIPEWIELDEKGVLNWFDLPDNSVIVIDECQDIWRPRTSSAKVPPHVERLEKHRHSGIDFVLTFQFPKQIDVIVRELITDHFHFHRALGLDASTRYKWDYLCLNPKSKTEQEKATQSPVAFDKKIFEKYHSASMHTSIRRIPWKVYLIIPIALILLFVGAQLYKKYVGFAKGENVFQTETTPSNSVNEAGLSLSGGVIRDNRGITTVQEFIELRTPRVDNLPSSAAIYDSLNQAVSIPRLQCIQRMSNIDTLPSCICYSQQGTKENVSEDQCIYYVTNGFPFDYTQPDTNNRDTERRTSSAGLRL